MLKLLFYVAAALVIYTLIKGCASGKINANTTVDEVVSDATQEGINMSKDVVGKPVSGAMGELKKSLATVGNELSGAFNDIKKEFK